jgi:hypothetical protein
VVGGINSEYAYPNLFPLMDYIPRMQKVALCQLRDVDQPLQAFFNADKGAETHNVGDHSLNNGTHLIALRDIQPGIGAESFQAQGNALFTRVHPQNMNLDLLAGVEHVVGVAYPIPRQLRDMDQTLNPAQIYKGAKGR